MISFCQATFSVPFQEKPILNNLNFTIHPNEFVIILGANGSGKSSLLKLISGGYIPSKGKIKNQSKRLEHLSQDTSETLFHDLTVLENVCLNGQKTRRAPFKISTQAEQQDYKPYLKEFHPHLPHKMQAPVGSLSGGERQSLALGLALKQNPDLLLLDEHTSALDPKTAAAIMSQTNQAIGHRDLTTLMVTHNIQHALEFGTRLIALSEGEIILDVQGARKQALEKKDLMEIYYAN